MQNLTESQHQQMIFHWAKAHEYICPELALLHHIPNGGSRNKIEAVNLKRQGVKSGVPDLCLPVARNGYHGLYIELKADKGKLTPNQKTWLKSLVEQGYDAQFCHGHEEAIEIIKEYLR